MEDDHVILVSVVDELLLHQLGQRVHPISLFSYGRVRHHSQPFFVSLTIYNVVDTPFYGIFNLSDLVVVESLVGVSSLWPENMLNSFSGGQVSAGA